MFSIARLEDCCYSFIAENIEQVKLLMPNICETNDDKFKILQVIDNCEFHDIIREDAQSVECREDVDSIDIIDQIRYHLTAESLDEAHDKLEIIDLLLEQLDLDA